MATFIGTAAGEYFFGDAVSPSVSVNPPGSLPSDLVDFINGAGGDDVIGAGGGDDTLLGGDQNDELYGGAGADKLDGGSGVDTADYSRLGGGTGVSVSLATGLGLFNDAQGDKLTSIENLVGTNGADTLIGNAGANYIDATIGNDTLDGGVGDDTLYAGPGDDILNGGAGDDALYGDYGDAYGDDFLRGGPGADLIYGVTNYPEFRPDFGNDTASYTESPSGVSVDLVSGVGRFGNAQGDQLIEIENLEGSGFDDVLTGSERANRLAGFGGDDRLVGGVGDDTLRGGAGADVLDGGGGFDWASYEDSNDRVGVDLLVGKGTGGFADGDRLSLIDHVRGSSFADTLSGDTFGNTIEGGDGGDTLNGRSGADHLLGGGGTDALGGGAGYDWLEGGAALDRFDVLPGSDVDYILDFTDGVDRLRFTGFGPAFDTPAEIVVAATTDGSGIRITLPDAKSFTGETVVWLDNFDLAKLSAADFA